MLKLAYLSLFYPIFTFSFVLIPLIGVLPAKVMEGSVSVFIMFCVGMLAILIRFYVFYDLKALKYTCP